jgi:hypothetical protein
LATNRGKEGHYCLGRPLLNVEDAERDIQDNAEKWRPIIKAAGIKGV